MYKFIVKVLKLICHILFPYKSAGVEKIPKTGAVIISCNHTSVLDVCYLLVTCPRTIHFMAKSELFKIPVFSWIIRKMNAFPVKRGSGGADALNYGIELLNKGEVVGIFPEGTRSKTGIPGKAKKGISVMIAMSDNVKVIPTAICRKGRTALFNPTKIKYGEPETKESLGANIDDKRSLVTAANRIMDTTVKMWRQGV